MDPFQTGMYGIDERCALCVFAVQLFFASGYCFVLA